MACTVSKRRVTINVEDGEFLHFAITAAPTQGNYTLVKDGKVVLRPPAKTFTWPKENQLLDDESLHAFDFGADFLTATKYTYKVTVRTGPNSVKSVVKDCSWTGPGQSPRSGFSARVK